MSKIIVGTDFSKGSGMAAQLAVDIANHFREDLLFVGPAVKGMSHDEMSLEIAKLNQAIPFLNGIKLENRIYKGEKSLAEVLCTLAEKESASMVVVGTQAIAGLQKRLWGADTYDIIERLTCPVLCVREDFQFNSELNNILLPIDNTPHSRQKISVALRFAKSFGSTLHLVALNESTRPDVQARTRSYARQAQQYLEEMGAKNTLDSIEVRDDVSSSLRSYAARVNADMMILMTEPGSKLSRLFADRHEHRTLAESIIPILTMPSEQLHTLHI